MCQKSEQAPVCGVTAGRSLFYPPRRHQEIQALRHAEVSLALDGDSAASKVIGVPRCVTRSYINVTVPKGTTVTSPATKADPYKDLSEDQKARVEKALAKANTKKATPQEDPAPAAEVATVETVVDAEIVGEVATANQHLFSKTNRSRADVAKLRQHNISYQVCEPLAADDMDALRRSILDKGIQLPVIIDRDGNILDGHNRVHIAIDHGLFIPTVVVDLASDAEKRALAWELNRARRQMTAEQKAEIRWQKVVVEGRPVAEVAKELHETSETVLRNVRKDAQKRAADSSADGNAAETEVLTPTERQRRKIVDAHKKSPHATDTAIAKEIGAPKATVNRVRNSLKSGNKDEKVIKNKTAPKPTVHDDFAKAVVRLSKAADEIVRVARDPRASRSGAKMWEANGQELVNILNKLGEISGRLQKAGK